MLLYAVRRAIGIVRAAPSKLFMVLTPRGWSRFFGLTREKREKSPEEISRLVALKQAQREEFKSDAWQHEGGISRRRYNAYEDYVAHQSEKLEQIGGEAFVNPEKAVKMFRRRFELIAELPPKASVIC